MAAVETARPALPARVAKPREPVSPPQQAAEPPDGFWYSVKRRVLGPPLVNEQLGNERLSRPLALGVLFTGFPFQASFVAEDSFLPHWLTRRGHRAARSGCAAWSASPRTADRR